MARPRLTYFDFAGSRGEECRLALHIAGVDFDDVRVPFGEWPALKPHTPFGALPTFEVPGEPVLAQSNAILGLIGRLHGLLPADPHEAARHEALMHHVEDARAQISPTMRMGDADARRAAREALAAGYLPAWAAATEKQLTHAPFFGGAAISVVDLKLYVFTRWLRGGTLDHIPTTVLDACPRLLALHDAVGEHPRVRDWQARRA